MGMHMCITCVRLGRACRPLFAKSGEDFADGEQRKPKEDCTSHRDLRARTEPFPRRQIHSLGPFMGRRNHSLFSLFFFHARPHLNLQRKRPKKKRIAPPCAQQEAMRAFLSDLPTLTMFLLRDDSRPASYSSPLPLSRMNPRPILRRRRRWWYWRDYWADWSWTGLDQGDAMVAFFVFGSVLGWFFPALLQRVFSWTIKFIEYVF